MKKLGLCDAGSYEYLTGGPGQKRLDALCKYLRIEKPVIVVDLETSGLNPILDDIFLTAFTFNGAHAFVIDMLTVDATEFMKLLSVLPVANHNIGFDYSFIKAKYQVDINIYWDTYITYALANAGIVWKMGGASLGTIAQRFLGRKLHKDLRKDFATDKWQTDEHIAYAADDVLTTWSLIPYTAAVLKAARVEHIWNEVERPFIRVLVDLHLNGIDFNLDAALDLRDQYQQRVDALRKKIEDATLHTVHEEVKCKLCRNGVRYKKDGGGPCPHCNGTGRISVTVQRSINPSSSQQLIAYLKSKGITIPTKTRPDGSIMETVDARARKTINHELIYDLDEYAAASKILNGFLLKLTTPTNVSPDGNYNHITHRIHTSYTQVDTDTGRLSSRNPNLQNQKRDNTIRGLFVAPPNHMMIMSDFSQYEVRIIAEASSDPRLQDFFFERAKLVDKMEQYLLDMDEVIYFPELGMKYKALYELQQQINSMDFHNVTALALFNLNKDNVDFESTTWKTQRSIAKSISFAIPYGAGPLKIAASVGISEEDARRHLDRYFKLYPKVKEWLEKIRKNILIPDTTGVNWQMGFPDVKLSWAETFLGRKRFFILPDENLAPSEYKRMSSAITRQASNFPIQGVNADVIKLAMTQLHNIYQNYDDTMIRLSIHDEIVTTCPQEIYKIIAREQVRVMKEVSARFLKVVPTEVGTLVDVRWRKG